jgi:hypothetical protein
VNEECFNFMANRDDTFGINECILSIEILLMKTTRHDKVN